MKYPVSENNDAINRLRDRAFETGNIWHFIDCFTNDMVWMPPGERAIVGKDACRAWATRFDEHRFNISSISEEIVVVGDWAFNRFVEVMVKVSKGDEAAEPVYYQGFWTLRRLADGSWKAHHFIWNRSPPIE